MDEKIIGEAKKTTEDAVAAEWQVGDVILDLYEVTGILGEGGMGKVYKVHHKGWKVDLAVKSPRPDIFTQATGKENFVREAETWVNLGLHPHIVSCYYVRTLGGIPRVFAEYVEGGSLADWIRSRKLYEGGPKKALERILDIAIQFAWGLQYAHEQGLVHQDVKPDNVMMTTGGTVKVADFGLSKARGRAGEKYVPGSGRSILVSAGWMSPPYCSPEQHLGELLSHRTDIWSWGVSVLEMFCGELNVCEGRGNLAAVKLEGFLETEDKSGEIPPMPEALAALLRRCFQRDPVARPRDMLEIASELQKIYRQTTRSTYHREAPKAVDLKADGLSNRAVSFLDLGKKRMPSGVGRKP
ncbi:MAG: serine/threonine-protein kinase [Terriglobia bacterium]